MAPAPSAVAFALCLLVGADLLIKVSALQNDSIVYAETAYFDPSLQLSGDMAELLWSSVAAAEAAANYAANKPVIVAIGDSQTAFGNSEGGWVNRMAAAYGATVDVLNRGVGMGTTRGAKALVEAFAHPGCPQARKVQPVALATICFGSNDAAPVMGNVNNRMTPLEEYASNLRDMIATLRQGGARNILLITPPPFGRPNGPALVEPYAQAMIAVAQEQQVAVADFFAAVVATPDYVSDILRADRLHLTPAGNQLMYDTVMAAVEQQLPQAAPKAARKSMLNQLQASARQHGSAFGLDVEPAAHN